MKLPSSRVPREPIVGWKVPMLNSVPLRMPFIITWELLSLESLDRRFMAVFNLPGIWIFFDRFCIRNQVELMLNVACCWYRYLSNFILYLKELVLSE